MPPSVARGESPESVSMESGLEDRNNRAARRRGIKLHSRLNGVRPRRPEQFRVENPPTVTITVSMESGLEDRNNQP